MLLGGALSGEEQFRIAELGVGLVVESCEEFCAGREAGVNFYRDEEGDLLNPA